MCLLHCFCNLQHISQDTPPPANIDEVIPQIPKAWPYEPHDYNVRCCCPWNQEPAKKGLPFKLTFWSILTRWMIKVSTHHDNQVELAPPDYFSDREAYIYSVTWPTKVTMTTLLLINLDMTENKETTWTWLLQSQIKFHEKCQQGWSKDPVPDQFKKWHPDLILLSHQGRGGFDLGEQAPELQRGVGVRGAEGRLPGQLDHDLTGRMARAWGGARLHQGRAEVRHGPLC